VRQASARFFTSLRRIRQIKNNQKNCFPAGANSFLPLHLVVGKGKHNRKKDGRKNACKLKEIQGWGNGGQSKVKD